MFKAPAKLRLGIYYLRKSVFLIFLNNHITAYYAITYCLKRKNKKRFFSFQSMPNLNFAELKSRSLGPKRRYLLTTPSWIYDKLLKLTGFYCHAEQSEASGLQMRIMYICSGRDSSLRSDLSLSEAKE
jgi:hypothetical protein